jgi:hypothetical protein
MLGHGYLLAEQPGDPDRDRAIAGPIENVIATLDRFLSLAPYSRWRLS